MAEQLILVSMVLFLIGTLGLLTRRDAITIFLSVEIILNAANLAFVAFSKLLGNELGHVAVVVVIVIAAVEAAVGLSIVIRLKKYQGTLELNKLRELKG